VARLERWAAEARVDAAAAARARERSLRRQAEEEGTLAGVLADLAEAGVPVRVHVRSTGPFAGTVRAVGVDVVAVETGGGPGGLALVALAAVSSVRAGAGARAVTGDRRVASSLRLADVVAELAAEREAVRVHTDDGQVVAGEARWAGQDVVMLRAGTSAVSGYDPAAAAAYVPLAAIAALEL
jgi:hypothetical protein